MPDLPDASDETHPAERELSFLYKRIGELESYCRAHVEVRIEQEKYIAELESVLPALPPALWGTASDHVDIGRMNYTHDVTGAELRRVHQLKRERDDIQF